MRNFFTILLLIAILNCITVTICRADTDLNSIQYVDSTLSSRDQLVTEVRSGSQLVGCGAVNRASTPNIFLNILQDGTGSLTISISYFKLNEKQSGTLQMKIGDVGTKKIYFVDGSLATFGLTTGEIENANTSQVSINNIPISETVYRKNYNIIKKCLSRTE